MESAVRCACAGHCYTPGHRYRAGCESTCLLPGSRYCPQCACEVPRCTKPRHHGPLCWRHKKLVDGLPLPVQLVRAMRSCAHDMIPCDFRRFCDRFDRFKGDVGTLLAFAFLQEPSAVEAWIATGVPGSLGTRGSAGCQPAVFADSLVRTLRSLHEQPPRSEMQQLRRGGSWVGGRGGQPAISPGQAHAKAGNPITQPTPARMAGTGPRLFAPGVSRRRSPPHPSDIATNTMQAAVASWAP